MTAPKVIEITVDGEAYVAVPAQLVGRVGAHIEQQIRDAARAAGVEPSGSLFAYALQLRAIAHAAAEPRPEPATRSAGSVSGTVFGDAAIGGRLSTRAIAERLGVSDSYVRRLAREGALDAELVGGVWVADEAAVASYQQQRRSTA